MVIEQFAFTEREKEIFEIREKYNEIQTRGYILHPRYKDVKVLINPESAEELLINMEKYKDEFVDHRFELSSQLELESNAGTLVEKLLELEDNTVKSILNNSSGSIRRLRAVLIYHKLSDKRREEILNMEDLKVRKTYIKVEEERRKPIQINGEKQ